MKTTALLKDLKAELLTLKDANKNEIISLKNQIDQLKKLVTDFENNWLGHWASEDYNIYSKLSHKNTAIKIDADYIQEYLEKKTSINMVELNKNISTILEFYKEYQEILITELSFIRGSESFKSEEELLKKIENTVWQFSPTAYIKKQSPTSFFTYNPKDLLNKGIEVPPHLQIGGILFSGFSKLNAIESFEKLAKRVIRQIEIKCPNNETSNAKTDEVYNIINSFHNVACQLKNRYNNRETLIIKDEYDVQDLLYALLKTAYDDIRPEEYTPSYAGSAARVDFLLKKEQIIIEIKKTRKSLKDKDLGNQLILDSQHYKVHPDCKRLICFIYDPENIIQNPRGLEADLKSQSTHELPVEIFIRP